MRSNFWERGRLARSVVFFTLGVAALAQRPALRASPQIDETPSAFRPIMTAVASPAGAGASCSSLTTAPDGTVYLSWIEPLADGAGHALKLANFDAQANRWSTARLVAQGRDWFVNWADFPTIAAQPSGRLTAVWFVNNPATDHTAHNHHGAGYRAMVSHSADAGATWSAPAPLTKESHSVEFVSLQPLADGRLLAVWLDGRAKKNGGAQQLYSRLLNAEFASEPDTLIDASVCDCCQTALTAFPDGSALVAYRGRTPAEIRDIMTARFEDGRWKTPRSLSPDGWKIAGCPVNGPQLASDGPRISAAWYTGADEQPRVLVGTSTDAGSLFAMAQRADLGNPLGRVDTLMLHDGSQLLTWLEGGRSEDDQPAGIYLRRYASFGATLPPVLLAPSSQARGSGFPRIALLNDYADEQPARVLVSFTRNGNVSGVETLLVTLPDAALLAAADRNCECAGRAEQPAGYAFRGRISAVSAERSTLTLGHGALPGLLRAGEREFRAAPNVIAAVRPDREVLARIEQRGGEWWIFDVRVLVRAK